MKSYNLLYLLSILSIYSLHSVVIASTTMTENQIKNVERKAVDSAADRQRLQESAVLLAHYEIEARKLINMLDQLPLNGTTITKQAEKLMQLSENVIDSARFRLPQCDDYLSKMMVLKDMLKEISHEVLEKDYHRDGALPKAPAECYHTKDLYVHPASVIVLARDDRDLTEKTRTSIKNEITEVLVHTEVVRQLVIY